MAEFASPMRPRMLFIGSGLDAVSWRFRIAQYLPLLRGHGIEADVADLRQPLGQRLRALGAAARYDVVCVHRVLLSPIEWQWLHRAAPRYVFDFDDAIMMRDSAARRFDSGQRRRRFARMVRGAGAVIAGSAHLAEWARRHRLDATVIPSAVDLSRYPRQPPDAGTPTIGWMGSAPNLMYLRTITPALARLCARRPQARVKVVSDGAFAAADLPLLSSRWSLRDEVADLRSFQVGIMPLPDDPWTRGKCAVKILQYFAAGLPVVCSPVGANLEIVEHGRNGFLAASDDEWVARLDELLGDAALRRRFGERGRAMVEDRFSVHATLPRFLRVLGIAATSA
jgi:glycosyltransferase involved in cell wall biosynthesis